jgi:hypothetical protein
MNKRVLYIAIAVLGGLLVLLTVVLQLRGGFKADTLTQLATSTTTLLATPTPAPSVSEIPIPGTATLDLSKINIVIYSGEAVIGWSSPLASKGQVFYGTSPTDLSQKTDFTSVSISEKVRLNGLTGKTTYYYKIVTGAEDGKKAEATGSFKTRYNTLDVTNATITPTTTGAEVKWTVSKNAINKVVYGTNPATLSLSSSATASTATPAVTLSGLTGKTVYYYKAQSIASDGIAIEFSGSVKTL